MPVGPLQLESVRSAKATGKMRTPSWDGCSAFHQQAPYARTPHSTHSSTSLSSTSASKKSGSTSTRIKDDLYEKLSNFMCETEEADSQHTHRYVAKLNYATRDKELDIQCEQLAAEHANADIEHCCELVRKQKDLELKNAEESCIAQQVEMLQLQI